MGTVSQDQCELAIVDEMRAALGLTDDNQTQALVGAILSASRVFVGGAGRSLLMMKAFAMRLMHLGLSAHVVGETVTPAISRGDLLIVGTGSGQTHTTLAVVRAAHDRGATTAAITAHADSPVATSTDLVVVIHSPITGNDPQRSCLQPPGSLFEQCLLLFCEGIVLRLMRPLGTTEEQMRARHTKLE
jgi:6-phospho-3-hexuloisomerase